MSDSSASGDAWQAGDLALCVVGGRRNNFKKDFPDSRFPESGRIYTVETVGMSSFKGTEKPALWLVDGPLNHCIEGGVVIEERCWPAERFRKINPLTDEEIEEFRRERLVDRAHNLDRV